MYAMYHYEDYHYVCITYIYSGNLKDEHLALKQTPLQMVKQWAILEKFVEILDEFWKKIKRLPLVTLFFVKIHGGQDSSHQNI